MHIGQITSRESSKTPKIMSMRALFAGEGWTHRNCTSRMAPSFHASLLPMWAFPHAGKARGQEEVCVWGGLHGTLARGRSPHTRSSTEISSNTLHLEGTEDQLYGAGAFR